jgi:hypothetical protein
MVRHGLHVPRGALVSTMNDAYRFVHGTLDTSTSQQRHARPSPANNIPT